MSQIQGRELFFGLVGAVGAHLSIVAKALQKCLSEVGYQTEIIRVIELLRQVEKYRPLLDDDLLDKQYHRRMDAGDDCRKVTGLGDALARLSIAQIRAIRREKNKDKSPDNPVPRQAYILQSL